MMAEKDMRIPDAVSGACCPMRMACMEKPGPRLRPGNRKQITDCGKNDKSFWVPPFFKKAASFEAF
ncbi:hypothetical protein [Komagataeibacter kakiaceti]|uniref:hypothetical protein n=1 Tax=Komagataeibacter kakiaceti TaxID=943261 RepID=UPI00046F3882|nr:hypothetical protein [Komagataeibacter kakiaceti]